MTKRIQTINLTNAASDAPAHACRRQFAQRQTNPPPHTHTCPAALVNPLLEGIYVTGSKCVPTGSAAKNNHTNPTVPRLPHASNQKTEHPHSVHFSRAFPERKADTRNLLRDKNL